MTAIKAMNSAAITTTMAAGPQLTATQIQIAQATLNQQAIPAQEQMQLVMSALLRDQLEATLSGMYRRRIRRMSTLLHRAVLLGRRGCHLLVVR